VCYYYIHTTTHNNISSRIITLLFYFSLYNAEGGQKIPTSVHGKEGVFLEKIRKIREMLFDHDDS
jgi:hypothetical protein